MQALLQKALGARGNAVDVARRNDLPELTADEEACDSSGRVFTWGRGCYGRLGHGDETNQHTPKKVPRLQHVAFAAGGAGHSLFITSAGDLYTCGKNYLGQLGVGDDEDRWHPTLVPLGDGEKAVQAAGGANFSVVVCGSGAVYSMGCGYFHATMIGREAHANKPSLASALSGITVRRVACGELHALAVSDTNECYAWGKNSCGQCGADVATFSKSVHHPRCITALFAGGVSFVRASSQWSAVCSTGGVLYGMGENGQAQLAVDPTQLECTHVPQRISPDGARIVDASCSNMHGVCVAESGEVYGWGLSRSCCFGSVTPSHRFSEEYVESHVTSHVSRSMIGQGWVFPAAVLASVAGACDREGEQVTECSTGTHCTVLRSNMGRVFCTGDPMYGCERMNENGAVLHDVTVLDSLSHVHVRAVACRNNHTIILSGAASQ